MAVNKRVHTVEVAVETSTPESREYENKANADLDRQLCASIEAADRAGNEYLAELLRHELGSHYFQTR